MAENNSILKLNSVEDVCKYYGGTMLHPLVAVINLNSLTKINHLPKQFGAYTIVCTTEKSKQEYPEADEEYFTRLIFYAPGDFSKYTTGSVDNPIGSILTFNKELLNGTLLQNRIDEYPFFNNNSSNIITLHSDEIEMVTHCMRSIDKEIHHPQDKYSSHILAAGIHVLLSICMRYYENQIKKPHNSAINIVTRLNNILDRYTHAPASKDKEIPTVASCASELGLSPNYFGDVVRNTTKISAHTYIHRFIVNEVKRLLEYTNMNIGQIAYQLGFKYPHHLTRIFKKETGMTPYQFRSKKRHK